jgi:hypothetical protein
MNKKDNQPLRSISHRVIEPEWLSGNEVKNANGRNQFRNESNLTSSEPAPLSSRRN